MKQFGQFLIEKGLLSEEDLVSVLVAQLESIPPLVSVIHAKRLLPAKDMLRALAYQANGKISFKLACVELGLWTDELARTVDAEVNRVKIPLGQLLVKIGKIDFQTITSALDEYLAQQQSSAARAPGTGLVVARPEAKKVPGTQPPPREGPPREESASATLIDPAMIGSFSVGLTVEKLRAMTVRFHSILKVAETKGSEAMLAGCLIKASQEAHEIRAMGRLIKAHLTEKLATLMEDLLIAALPLVADLESAEIEELGKLGVSFIDLIKDLRGVLLENRSENAFWTSSAGRYEKFCDQAEALRQLFSHQMARLHPARLKAG